MAAQFIAVFICLVGIIGLAAPDALLRVIQLLQIPFAIYVTAVLRIVIGLVFVRAAPGSRAPTALSAFGYFIVAAGIVTPFVGAWGAEVVLNWWTSGGPWVVRSCTGTATAIGLVILFAVTPSRAKG